MSSHLSSMTVPLGRGHSPIRPSFLYYWPLFRIGGRVPFDSSPTEQGLISVAPRRFAGPVHCSLTVVVKASRWPPSWRRQVRRRLLYECDSAHYLEDGQEGQEAEECHRCERCMGTRSNVAPRLERLNDAWNLSSYNPISSILGPSPIIKLLCRLIFFLSGEADFRKKYVSYK
jgi:hypothetical protein